MRFLALATDYDGTLAHHGVVDEPTLAALHRAKKSGRKLLMVTGRELPDLHATFPHVGLFDLVVAENGVVLFHPATGATRVLAEAPPPEFAARLRARGVPLSTGHVIVATVEPHHTIVLETIREMGLELQVIFNKGSVMVLPSGVNKATGLKAALPELGLSTHNAVGVGDAENDHAFLRVCECSAAVANALPAVKETADIVTKAGHGAGVAELIDRMIANDLDDLKTLSRHRIAIGTVTSTGEDVHLDPAGRPLLICGTPDSGKATLTATILEQLSTATYQALVIDPEGDFSSLGFATHLGSKEKAPLPDELLDALKDTRRSFVLDLSAVPEADQPGVFEQFLPALLETKTRTGRPHWLVISGADRLLPSAEASTRIIESLPDRGLMYITARPEALARESLASIETLLITGQDIRGTISQLTPGPIELPVLPTSQPGRLPTGEALLWTRGETEFAAMHTRPPAGE
jgi:hydroxymethylpyrimidine pyrophosphatase-like HAD family hydrolase